MATINDMEYQAITSDGHGIVYQASQLDIMWEL